MNPVQSQSTTSRLRALSSRKICSSLPLQQLLYYNVFWSLAWFVTFSTRICLRYGRGLAITDPDIVRTVLTVFWLIAEPVRLAAGYYGNLQENVPWLVIFTVLTLAPQTAVCYYLMLAQYDMKAMDKALQVVMAAFIHAEFFAAVHAICRMFKQRKQFYLWEWVLQQQAQQTRQRPYHQQQAFT